MTDPSEMTPGLDALTKKLRATESLVERTEVRKWAVEQAMLLAIARNESATNPVVAVAKALEAYVMGDEG